MTPATREAIEALVSVYLAEDLDARLDEVRGRLRAARAANERCAP